MSRRLDALVLDGSQRAALAALRSLGRAGHTVGVLETERFGRPAAASSRWCAYSEMLSDFTVGEPQFVGRLVDLAKQNPAPVLVAVHDGTLSVLRRHRKRIDPVARIALPPPSVLDLLVDKSRTLALAADCGVRIPRTVPLADPSDARTALAEVGLPAVLKPVESWVRRDGGASRLVCRGVRTVDDLSHSSEEMLAAGGRLVVQEYLPGSREGVSLFAQNGRIHARFAQIAYRMMPPVGGTSVLREGIELPADATAAAEDLVTAAGLEGYAEVEFRRDAGGRPVLMEVNPRLSASVEVAVRSGVDFPALLYSWAAGDPVPHIGEYRAGVRMRWLGGDLLWLRSVWREQGQLDVPTRRDGLGTFFGGFLQSTNYDYVDLADPRPALRASRTMLGRTARGWLDRVGPKINRCEATRACGLPGADAASKL